MKNEKKVTLDQLETALNRVKEAAPGTTPVDDTATDAEVNEMLDRVFGTKAEDNGPSEDGGSEGEGDGEYSPPLCHTKTIIGGTHYVF